MNGESRWQRDWIHERDVSDNGVPGSEAALRMRTDLGGSCRAASSTNTDENNPLCASETVGIKVMHLQSQAQSSFFIVCAQVSASCSLLFFFLKVKLLLFFIYKDVLKSHLEALKVFLPEASYRYIKSTHFTNEND